MIIIPVANHSMVNEINKESLNIQVVKYNDPGLMMINTKRILEMTSEDGLKKYIITK